MLRKPTAMQFLSGALVVSVLFVLSCNESERHEMLTVFFDGVPPLGGDLKVTSQTQLTDPNAPPDPNALPDPNAPPTIVWSIHPPQRDCVQCHGEKKERRFSREVQLVAQVPDLCYQCHPDYSELQGHVHGPVGVGVCTFCHEPHKTRNPYLLKQPVPDLCYGCHEAEVIEFFDSKHAAPSYENCIQCHEGHSSENPSLLKKDRQKNSE